MRLSQVQIQNYKSVVDSGVVDIEERVTVLIGKNEQGKTNFLKALASFDPKKKYMPNDLPTHLRPMLEAREPSTIPIVTLWLTPEPSDRSELKGIIANCDSIRAFKVTRFYDGHYEYKLIQSKQGESPLEFSKPDIGPNVQQMIKLAKDLRTKLGTHATRLAAFASSLTQANGHIDQFVKANFRDEAQVDNIIKTFATTLQSLPNQDQAIQQDIAVTIKDIQARYAEIQKLLSIDRSLAFKGRIPQFLFHSMTLDRIPNEVNVAEFVADPEKTSKGMANLCGVAGLSTCLLYTSDAADE